MKDIHSVFDALVKTSGAIVWRADIDGVLEAIAPAELALDMEQWAGRNWLDAIHPDDLQGAIAAYRAAAETDEVADVTYRALKGGQYRWFQIRAMVHRDSSAKRHWVGTARDIHDQVIATEELRHSERVYRAMVEASASVLWRAAAHGGATRISGWSNLEGKLGQSWQEEIHPEDRETTNAQLQALVSTRKAGEFRYRARTPSGDYRLCLCRAVPILDADGEVVEWVGTLNDIQDKVLAEEALQRAERLRSVGRLTAGVAHDFNNLLMVITGGAEALAERLAPDSPLRAQAEMILHASERGADLVRDLLAFSRQQPLQPRPVAITALLSRMEPMIRRLIGEDVEIELAHNNPAAACMADPAQLEASLINLCINARDAMPAGGRLRLETQLATFSAEAAVHAAVQPGAYVVLSVTDTGCGMDNETLDLAVEPFFTTKEAGGGSGMGLSMVYGFVRQSAGHMTIASSPDQGACVRLYLPATALPCEDDAPAPSAALATPLRVLLVEDDALVREQVTRHLEKLGCWACAASTGPEALEVLTRGDEFDLLMTDVIMPGGMSGFDLAERVRGLRPDLPIVFTSGYTDERVRLGEQGPHCSFLQKPYRRAALAQALEEALQRTQPPQTVRPAA